MAVDLFERPVVLRIPFRFGAATVTHAPQAFVQARIQLEDGRQARGAAAELMVPKWFDKSPQRTNDDNVDDLRRSLSAASEAYTSESGMHTAFGHSAAHYAALIAPAATAGDNALLASYGPALVDRAVMDALCRALNLSFQIAIRSNVAAIDASLTPDLEGFDLDSFLAGLTGASRIAARHTVGMLDSLTRDDIDIGVDDGLPQSLDEVIAHYGNRYFKLKLSGDADRDVSRLVRIADVLDALPDYAVTLDGNEQFADVESLGEFWRKAQATPALARLVGSTLYFEQPLPRSATLHTDVSQCALAAALLIDESDASLDAYPAARALGYTGVSSKSCKGFYKSLLNAARRTRWNLEAGSPRYFLSAEDLTTQAGLALQQDLALAALLGLQHIERNGHHYVNGFAGQGAGRPEQQRFLAAHPDLYEAHDDTVALAIRGGWIALESLDRAGFATGACPAWDTLQPLRARSVSLA